MSTIWTIAANDLRIFLKERGNYVWLFVMPVVFIYLFGTAMKGPSGEPRDPRPRVAIENNDEGYLGELFVEQLSREGFAIAKPLDDAPVTRTIRIPANFTARVEDAEQVDVEFLSEGDAAEQPTAMVQIRITRAIVGLTSAILSMTVDPEKGEISEAGLREILSMEPAVKLDARFAGRRVIPAGFNQSVPGYLVMFVLMNLLIFGGLAISQERGNGTLRRIAIHPVTYHQIIFGKILGRFLLGGVQIGYLLLVSRFFFGMDYGGNLFPIAVTMLIFAWGCASLGVFIGSVIKTPETVQGTCTLFAVALAAIGGCWWPLEVVPDTARQFGMMFPTAWAMHAMHQLISFGGGFSEIQSSLMLITGFAVVSTGMAARFLKIE